MSPCTRMMLALFVALTLGGLVEHFAAAQGPAPDRLVRLQETPPTSSTWLAVLR